MSLAHHVVIGPPGCGKTQYIARQAARAQEKYGADGVMISSLTRTAAREIADRAQAESKVGLEHDAAATLHSHARRALARQGIVGAEEDGKPKLADTPQGLKAWNESQKRADWKIDPGHAVNVDDLGERVGDTRSGDGLLQLHHLLRARCTPPEWIDAEVERFTRGWVTPQTYGYFVDAWEHFKRVEQRPDFTDLIELALKAELPPPGSPGVLFVDEAQDNSRLEMDLIRSWGKQVEQVVTVGDPLQCLYHWRGASPDVMTPEDAASSTVLGRSYRVPRAVLNYAVAWARRGDLNPPTYEPRLDGGVEVGGAVELLDRSLREPSGVIAAVERDIAAGRTVMLLASASYLLAPLLDGLRNRGLPFWNPYRVTAGHWNPLRSGERLRAFLRPSRAVWGEEASFWTGREAARWIEPLSARKAPLRERGSKGTRVKELKAYDARVLRGEQLFPLFADETQDERAFDLDAEWWHETLLADHQRRNRYPMGVWRRDPAALTAQPPITIGTIHSVKGGQADAVYVFPDLSPAAYGEWQTRDPAVYRLFYVAFTRAREKLVLCRERGQLAVEFPQGQIT